MSTVPSSILIYGICETPSILWNAHCLNLRRNKINRQYICLDKESLTIRMGSKGWLDIKSEQLLQFQANSDMNAYTKEILLSKVNAFSRPIKNVLISYFTWIENKCLEYSKGNLSKDIDPLFANAQQLFFNAYLPLPHPKIVISDANKKYIGVANFDLGFCIRGKVYLLTFSDGQFIRKTEREYRERLLTNNHNFIFADLPKPKQESNLDDEFINILVNTIPSLENFAEKEELPHGIYYPEGLNINFR